MKFGDEPIIEISKRPLSNVRLTKSDNRMRKALTELVDHSFENMYLFRKTIGVSLVFCMKK